MMGAGKADELRSYDVLVAVINTASTKLPNMVAACGIPVMLVIDECHRAGSDSFRRVLTTSARYRLGLSATPERDEFDEHGEPLRYDGQAVALSLGQTVFRFGLKQAREAGWLPSYEIHHHGVPLSVAERVLYDDVTRQVDDIKKRLEGLGEESRRARTLVNRPGDLGSLARAYVATTAKRKDVLYKALSRNVIAARLVRDAYRDPTPRRMLLFHERVAESQALHEVLAAFVPCEQLALEHSQLSEAERRRSIARFRSGEARVLVSVKSLVEGIDVPEADVGMSVASSASVRQRIQSLGRVLRRSFDEAAAPKTALMHVLYVSDTVDEHIYAKEDWSDITGEANNVYWRWNAAGDERTREVGSPREPQLSEEAMWEVLHRSLPAALPYDWPGSANGQEYSVDTRGNVTNASGTIIVNPQGVDRMVERIRGRPGGRFRVTPKYRLVLISRFEADALRWSLTGMLAEPFEAESPALDAAMLAVHRAPEHLQPGDVFPGPLDAVPGILKLRQKSDGMIERRLGGEVQRAMLDRDSAYGENAQRVLAAWRSMGLRGFKFFLSSNDVAWFRHAGKPTVLAYVPGGFAWLPLLGDDARHQVSDASVA